MTSRLMSIVSGKKPEITHLYHGSAFSTLNLMPGFNRSGKLEEWDNTESNKFLYASADPEVATEQAFASQASKMFLVNRFQSHGNNLILTIERSRPMPRDAFKDCFVYLYRIAYHKKDWQEVNNRTNGLTGEFKTQKTLVTEIESTQRILVNDWLKDKNLQIVLVQPKPSNRKSHL